jgi:hypothetical protein
MDTFRHEQSLLRSEAQDLKRCQLQYFVLSITGTGALLGLAKFFSVDHAGAAMLAPLTILLPCWLLFFDKATTLTRLTGYVRLLEDFLGKKKGVTPIYIGYENALAKFRTEEAKLGNGQPEKGIQDRLLKMFYLGTRHRFWMINWYTFFSLSVVCCTAALRWNINQTPPSTPFFFVVAFSFFLVVLCATYTTWLIRQLTFGKYSYDHVTEFWKMFMPSHK